MNINPLPSETSSSSNSSNSITEPTGEQEIIIFASNSNEEDSDEKVEDWSNIANSSSPSSSLPSGGSGGGDMEIPASAPSIKPEACAANSNEKAAFEVMGDDFPMAMDVEFSFFVCFYGTRPEGPSSLSPVAHVVFTSFCVFVLFANRDWT